MSIVFFGIATEEWRIKMERFETKYDLLNRIYADDRLKRTTKAVMQYLVAKADDRSCHPSVATIAAAIRMSERTVQRHMRHLEQYGYIKIKSRFYRSEQLPNQYEFVLDVTDDAEHPYIKDKESNRTLKEQAERFDRERPVFNKMNYIKEIAGTGLSNKECLVLIYFTHKANRGGITYGSVKTISQALHMSQRLLWKIILKLRSEGYLMLKNRKGDVIVKLLHPEAGVVPSGTENVATSQQKEKSVYPESGKVYQRKRAEINPVIKVREPEERRKCKEHKGIGGKIRYMQIKWKKFWSELYQRIFHFLS